jgi:3-deoxy-D-manno-octulosonic-acid transferase
MLFYNLLIHLVHLALPIFAIGSKKLKLGVIGRSKTWHLLDQKVKKTVPKIWVHVASLGEYEQIVPVLEQINRDQYQVVLSFFSPSGYENKKNTPLADVVCYLPIDTPGNAMKFLDIVQPDLSIMVKYEFWPNYLKQLSNRNVRTILVSAVFRKEMPFFKWYGRWMTPLLTAIDHFFVQDAPSIKHLENLGYDNVTLSGDTRFDRASTLIEQSKTHPIFDKFVNGETCLVIGSSWPEDIAIMKQWLTTNDVNKLCKVIIAPHEVGPSHIQQLKNQLGYPCAQWSHLANKNAVESPANNTLIIDTIGQLTTAYNYADMAYVGGAMGTKGLHNILEAATYGVPVVIGKNYDKFPEAGKLEDLGGLFSVANSEEFSSMMQQLLEDDYLREKSGMICGHWINSNTGATRTVLEYLKQHDEQMVLTTS